LSGPERTGPKSMPADNKSALPLKKFREGGSARPNGSSSKNSTPSPARLQALVHRVSPPPRDTLEVLRPEVLKLEETAEKPSRVVGDDDRVRLGTLASLAGLVTA
jgi:hypothetical protein